MLNGNHVYVLYINHSQFKQCIFPERSYNRAMHVWITPVNVKQMDKIISTIYIYGILIKTVLLHS